MTTIVILRITLITLILAIIRSVVYCQKEPIVFGQSCPLSGPSSLLGINLRAGIQAAFDEVNELGGVNGRMLQLNTLDDTYEPLVTVPNTASFLQNDTIFGLIGMLGQLSRSGILNPNQGYVGTPTSKAVIDSVKNASIPFIGAFTGASFLRNPFHYSVINLRASYDDETAAMVHYLVNVLRKRRISILYQDDAFGSAGYTGITNALKGVELTLRSEGKFVRNTLNVETSVDSIAVGVPEAIVMIGTYQPLAKFVKLVKASPKYRSDVIFLTVSFVGSVPFAQHLGSDYERVYVTQVVPLPTDNSEYKEIHSYQVAMEKYNPSMNFDFISLEGYLTGKFVASVLQRLPIISRKSFLDAIYNSGEFFIGGLRFGPYENCVNSSISGCSNCNQGLHQVWTTKIGPNETFTSIPVAHWSWDTCISDPNNIESPVLFGQSAALTGISADLGQEMRAGILSAFEEYNHKGGFKGRSVQLLSLDDGYEPGPCYNNTVTLIESEKVFGLIGYVGTPTTKAAIGYINNHSIPLIGAYTGASFLRYPFIRNAVNIRSSYDDETAAMINFLLNFRAIRRISILYQADSFGEAGLSGIKRSMTALGLTLLSSGTYERNTLNVESAVTDISYGGPEAIVMIGTALPLAKFVGLVKNSNLYKNRDSMVFITLSFVGSSAFAAALTDTRNVYITEVVPFQYDTSITLVSDYLASLNTTTGKKPDQTSLEGYIAGRIVTKILDELESSDLPLTRSNFLDMHYKTSSYSLRGITLGPYQDTCDHAPASRRISGLRTNIDGTVDAVQTGTRPQCCNSGMREVIVLSVTSPNSFSKIEEATFSFPLTCQSEPTSISDPLIFALPLAFDKQQEEFNLVVQQVFDSINLSGGIGRRRLLTKYYDTKNEFLSNYEVMNNRDMVFAVLGLNRETTQIPSTANLTIPLIAIRSGEAKFKQPYNPLNIIIRPTLSDEAAAIVSLIQRIKLHSVEVIVDNTSDYWQEALGYLKTYMKAAGKSCKVIDFSPTIDVSKQLKLNSPEQVAVLLMNTNDASICAGRLLNTSSKLKIVLPYDVDYKEVVVTLNNRTDLVNRLVVTEIFPWRNSQEPVFSFFSRDMDTFGLPVTSDSLEGYMAAKLVIDVLESINEKVTKQVFIDTLYDTGKFNIGGYVLGPIGKSCVGINPQCMSMAFCSCNQLGREVHHNIISDTIQMSFSPLSSFRFESCGVLHPHARRNYIPIIVVMSIVACVLIVTILIALILLYLLVRQRKMKYAPKTGLMTICFTDVQNSTVLWEVNAKEMQRALAIHNKVMRALIDKHKGFEIKTQGDSFMVAFVDPCSAVLWACEVQETMINQNWSSELLGLYDCRVEFDAHKQVIFKGLRVRIGIHYGEAERVLDPVTRRFDYFGTTVNKAARCEGEARGGQILITDEVFRLVSHLLREDNTSGDTASADVSTDRSEDSHQYTAVSMNTNDLLASECILYRKKGSFKLKGLNEQAILYEVVLSILMQRTYDEPSAQQKAITDRRVSIVSKSTTARKKFSLSRVMTNNRVLPMLRGNSKMQSVVPD